MVSQGRPRYKNLPTSIPIQIILPSFLEQARTRRRISQGSSVVQSPSPLRNSLFLSLLLLLNITPLFYFATSRTIANTQTGGDFTNDPVRNASRTCLLDQSFTRRNNNSSFLISFYTLFPGTRVKAPAFARPIHITTGDTHPPEQFTRSHPPWTTSTPPIQDYPCHRRKVLCRDSWKGTNVNTPPQPPSRPHEHLTGQNGCRAAHQDQAGRLQGHRQCCA